MLVDPSGGIWAGSWGITHISNGIFHSFVRKRSPSQWFDAQITTAMYWDRDDSLWISYPDQLARFQNGKFQAIAPALEAIHSGINAILRDAAGDLWLGGGALHRWRGSALQMYRDVNGAPLAEIRELLEDPGGGLWIASDDGLLFFKDGRFRIWTEADGLSSNHVLTLYKDKSGTLWIGTADGGLNRFENGRFQHMTAQNGLYSDDIYSIREDRAGFFWLTCRKGISRVRKDDLNAFAAGRLTRVSSLHLGKSNGFLSVDCRGHGQPRSFQSKDGSILVPTRDGIAILQPDRVPSGSRPPHAAIESCILNHRVVSCQPEIRIRPGPSDLEIQQPEIRIRPGPSDLEIQYTAINFARPEQTHFRYQLAGLDTNWTEADTERQAFFSHLPPGSYLFRVIAANGDGMWSENAQSVSIVVLPPFYRTWWFLTLVSVVALCAVAFGWQHRVAQLRRDYATQQAFSRQLIASQERERSRIAGELHDSLGQSLVIIRNWAMLGSSQLGLHSPAREELDEISATAAKAIHEVREIAYNLGPYHLDRLGLANAMEDMIHRVAQPSGVRFTTHLDPLPPTLSREAAINLFRIAQEAINNIVKHSGATEATVVMRQEAGNVKLLITDNGTGFHPRAALSTARENGIGLTGMEERVRLLKGTWAVRSAPGKGTAVEITLKTGNLDETASNSDRR